MTDDHLARLCFDGAGSSGQYTPYAYSLRLAGAERTTDHVVYLHEVHHAALNDVTAWGTALHVYSRLPKAARAQFGPLLDACRTTHESLATFSSVQIAVARHGALDGVLTAYPTYVPLYAATTRLTAGIEGANRRLQMVTALARLCMQTPVIEAIIDTGLEAFRLAAIPQVDRPDDRWNWLLRLGPAALADVAAVADRTVLAEYGPAVLDSDVADGDLEAVTDADNDAVWDAWELSAYAQLRTALTGGTRARVLGFNDHQAATAEILALVTNRYGWVGLRAAFNEEQRDGDSAIASSVLQQVRHEFNGGTRHRASLIPSGELPELVEALAVRSVIDGRPAVVVDARPTTRLAALYRWPSDTLPAPLHMRDGPVVAVRAVVDDGEPDSVIGHVVVAEPRDLAELSQRWRDRGHLISCVSASCMTDRAWLQRWLVPIRATGPMFVLVDVEPDRFVPSWVRDGRDVTAITVEVSDNGGERTALLFTANRDNAWWLVVANDVTVQLMLAYLRGQLGSRLRTDANLFEPIRAAAKVVISHILATESFVSFDALGTLHAD